MEILTGSLNTNGHDIDIGGNWTNNVGDTGFIEGTGTVTFIGSNESDITTDETFYNMAMDKPIATYTGLEINSYVIINVTNDLNIIDGTIEMNDNSTLNIGNDLNIALNAALNCLLDTGLNVNIAGDWNDLNPIQEPGKGFDPGSNTVTFNGSSDQFMTTTSPAEEFYNLVINKSAGEFKPNDNLQILGNYQGQNGTWYDNVSGLSHYFCGDVDFQSGSPFHANNSTVTFYGSADQTFNYVAVGGYFNHVVVDKEAVKTRNHVQENSEGSDEQMMSTDRSRSQTVILNSDLISQYGSLTIEEGTLDLNGNDAGSTGDITINDGGTIIVRSYPYQRSRLRVGDNQALTVNNGGLLDLIGVGGFNATVTRFSNSDNFDFNVESGGTISANYGDFTCMSTNGIYLKSGSIVDPVNSFNNCIFDHGETGGTMLRIDNDQCFTADNVYFSTNTWSGASNVMKSINTGEVTFTNAYGGFAGPFYEDDPYNRIHWSGFEPDLTITNAVWSDMNPYVCDTINVAVTVKNIGTVDVTDWFYVDLYYNLPSPPTYYQYGNQSEYIDTGLPAGDSLIVNFYTICNVMAESWSSYFQVDADSHIVELDENNNIWGPDAITWQTLPIINDLTIVYNSGTGSIELDWSYPAGADSFYVYRDTDAYFAPAPGNRIATTTESEYSEPASGTKYFYKVTAVKSCPATKVITGKRDSLEVDIRREKMQ